MGYAAGRPASHQEHHGLAPGRHQLHPQRRAGLACDEVRREHGPCAPSMAWRVVDAQHAFEHAVVEGRDAVRRRRQGARRAGDRRHRRIAALFRRSLWREGLGLRRRVRMAGRARPEAARASASTISTTSPTMSIAATWTSGGRSTASCSASSRSISSTSTASITGLVSRAITSPCGKIRIPLNEFKPTTPARSRNICKQIQRRRHPAHRRRHRRHLRGDRQARRQRPEIHAGPARHLLREVAGPRERP